MLLLGDLFLSAIDAMDFGFDLTPHDGTIENRFCVCVSEIVVMCRKVKENDTVVVVYNSAWIFS